MDSQPANPPRSGSDLPSLIAAVIHAFAADGPVQRRLGQHRPLQAEAALGFATFAQNQYQQERVQLFIQEQRAGIGKTLAVGVVMALDAMLNGNRGMISTNTRALRASYLATLADVNWIAETTLNELDCDRHFFPVIMQERTSAMQNISPSKIADLKRRILVGSIMRTPRHIELIDYFDTSLEHGDEPTFDGFYYDYGGALPDGTSQDDWSMCSADRQHVIWKSINERNNTAISAHIMLVTHSMTLRNSISRGRVLNTALIGDEEYPAPTGMLMIDEADKMPQIAYESQSPVTTLYTIDRLLKEIKALYSNARETTQKAATAGTEQVRVGLIFFEEWNASHSTLSPAVTVGQEDDLAEEIIVNLNAIDIGLKALRAIAVGQYNDHDRDILLSDRIERVQEHLSAIRNFAFYPIPRMSLRTFTDQNGTRDLEIKVNLGLGRWLINQYWRRYDGVQTHGFRGVLAISATLADLPPYNHKYSWFRKHFGYDAESDLGMLIEKPPIPANRREPYGSVSLVIVPEREGAPHPTNIDHEHMIDRDFVVFGNTALTEFHKLQRDRPQTRMLILFPSYNLINAFYAQMPHLHDRIVARQQGSNLLHDIARYANTPHGIFFGVDWEGVNFVDPEPPHRTLVDFLVMTKIPQPPSDHIRMDRIADWMVQNFQNEEESAKRKAFGISLREGSAHAWRKMVQGVGRGIRNSTDVIEAVLILDYRFPVPRHVAETRKIIRCGGNAAALFGNFDSIFDPYAVRHWSKMELTGEIVPIYPLHQ